MAVVASDSYFLLPSKGIEPNDAPSFQATKQKRKVLKVALAEKSRAKSALTEQKRYKETFDLHKDADALRKNEMNAAIYEFTKKSVRDGALTELDLLRVVNGEHYESFSTIKEQGQPAYDEFSKKGDALASLSKTLGGVPAELQPVLKELRESTLTLHEAARNGDVSAIRSFVEEKKHPVDYEDKQGISPLGYAIAAGHLEAVKALKELGATLFSVDDKGDSALHFAAAYGHAPIVKYLIESGSSVRQKNEEGKTALDLATAAKHDEVAALLK